MIDYKRAFDAAYPVIEAARKLKEHYKTHIAPDVAGDLITALNKCDTTYGVKLED